MRQRKMRGLWSVYTTTGTRPDIHLKVLECKQQSKSFFFYCGIFELVLVKLMWEVAHEMVYPITILLQEYRTMLLQC